jgi:hypothetical protein
LVLETLKDCRVSTRVVTIEQANFADVSALRCKLVGPSYVFDFSGCSVLEWVFLITKPL